MDIKYNGVPQNSNIQEHLKRTHDPLVPGWLRRAFGVESWWAHHTATPSGYALLLVRKKGNGKVAIESGQQLLHYRLIEEISAASRSDNMPLRELQDFAMRLKRAPGGPEGPTTSATRPRGSFPTASGSEPD